MGCSIALEEFKSTLKKGDENDLADAKKSYKPLTGKRWLPPDDRFRHCVMVVNDGCWVWFVESYHDGYGYFRIKGKTVSAHRYAYEKFIGAVPTGFQIDHLCRNRACVNPLHLEPVEQIENWRRGQSLPLINSFKTHCKRGHELAGDNLLVYTKKDGKVSRSCRICATMHKLNYYLKNRVLKQRPKHYARKKK